MKDYYYILGLKANCTFDEIKDAYRKLSKKLHPDLNQGDPYFENRFREVKEAFETLRDPVKRGEYDASLKQVASLQMASAAAAPNPPGRKYNTRRANPRHFQRKGPGVGMILALVLVSIITGVYLFEWLGTPKPPKANALTAIKTTPAPAHKKHKRKHNTANKIAGDSAKRIFDTTSISAVKLLQIKPVPAKPAPVKHFQAQTTTDNNINQHKNDFLYATYVLPNVTGLINMRAYDKFSSNIVTTIPSRSKVLVLEKGDIYYRVFYASNIGYVPKWSLEAK